MADLRFRPHTTPLVVQNSQNENIIVYDNENVLTINWPKVRELSQDMEKIVADPDMSPIASIMCRVCCIIADGEAQSMQAPVVSETST
mgnify:CR=1 FL=1